MEQKECKVIGELAREIGVQPYRIAYAHRHGRLPEPPRVGGKRVYDEEMTRLVQAYFTSKDKGDPKEGD